jgi:hypothetical protein
MRDRTKRVTRSRGRRNNNDNGQPDNMTIKAFSAVAQHSYVLGNAA